MRPSLSVQVDGPVQPRLESIGWRHQHCQMIKGQSQIGGRAPSNLAGRRSLTVSGGTGLCDASGARPFVGYSRRLKLFRSSMSLRIWSGKDFCPRGPRDRPGTGIPPGRVSGSVQPNGVGSWNDRGGAHVSFSLNRKARIQDPHENWLTIGDGRCRVAGRHHRGVGTSVVRQHGRRAAKCRFEAAK